MMKPKNPIVVYVQSSPHLRRTSGVQKERKTGRLEHLTPPPNARENESDDEADYYNHYGTNPSRHAACFRLCCTMRCIEATNSSNVLLVCHVTAETTRRCPGRRSRSIVGRSVSVVRGTVPLGARALKTPSSARGLGVVVVETSRLENFHGQAGEIELELRSSHDWANNQDEEDDKEEKVEDGIANDPTLAELGLLERIDWRSDLTAASC